MIPELTPPAPHSPVDLWGGILIGFTGGCWVTYLAMQAGVLWV